MNNTEKTTSEEKRIKRFEEITKEMFELYKNKNHDYGDSFHKLYKNFGNKYVEMRLTEKNDRLRVLLNKEAKVKEESIKDTLKDMANYCILSLMELEGL